MNIRFDFCIPKDEELLAHCLLNCKNSLEKTKNRLETYFNAKAAMPEIFRNRDPLTEEMEKVCSIRLVVELCDFILLL